MMLNCQMEIDLLLRKKINMPTITPTAIYHTTSPSECNELRKHLIIWVQNQATGYRANAAIGHTVKHHDKCTAKAESYDFMVKYLEGMEIVEQTPPIEPTRICPDTNEACEENCGIPDCHLKLSKMGWFDVN